MTNNQELGSRGEARAAEYLQRQGYKIIIKNHRIGHLEIDLIARHFNQLVFVEIKTRTKNTESSRENTLTKRQTHNLKRAINEYCFNNNLDPEVARLDLITILVDSITKSAKLRHYRDIL